MLSRLKRVALRVVARAASPLIRHVEEMLLAKRGANFDDAEAPIFIVGAPRTGSTILYQALTNVYQVQYIDNTACIWHRNLRFGLWLSRKKYCNQPHNNFESEHGDTARFGGHSPAECGAFWYRWLPQDRHFIDHGDIDPRSIDELREEVLGATLAGGAPVLFKNLNAGQRLRLIARAFPGARIIFLRRDPRFVVRSILSARKKLGLNAGEWWSIMPANVEDLKSMPEPKMVAAQVYYLEKQIEEDIQLFEPGNIKVLHYNSLSHEQMNSLANWLKVRPRSAGALPQFRRDELDDLRADEKVFLDSAVGEFEFKEDLFI